MKVSMKLELRNLYGGDGNVRQIQIRTPKLRRIKGRKQTKLEISSETSSEEELFEIKQQDINTFAKNENGEYIYRIGDKFKGALKQAAELYADESNEVSKAQVKRILNTVFCLPAEAILYDVKEKEEPAKVPQLLNTMGRNTMVIHQFDTILVCKCDIELVYPDSFNKFIQAFLRKIEMIPFGNKRKGTLKILAVTENGK